MVSISMQLSQMARTNPKTRYSENKRHSDLPRFESVVRISNLPIVENSIHIAGNVYDRLKRSNSLMSWSLCTAEQSLAIATASAKPAISVLNGPIMTIDHLLCKGIDIVEQRVPAVHLPPHLIYCNAREYVNNKIVRPVLMRAGSVKLIGSQAANAAVDRLDGALTVADKYVDRYLPADSTDTVDHDSSPSEPVSKTTRTIKHGARLSRKLQKRLTRRTLAEARALKEQGTECIHILLYIVELLATDPKLAFKKAKELWGTLSLPEPENQARPATLEQLLVLLTRESARRIVHLVNGTTALAAKTPRNLGRLLIGVSHQLLVVADATFRMMPIIGKRGAAKEQISAINLAIQRLNSSTNHLLERFATFLAGRPCVSKVTRAKSHQRNHNNHMSMSSKPPVNGIDTIE
ncbi:lipid storage droplets surface-binding protein 1 isoform X1 [Bombus affinis]|uniref:Lipid storage droplets surface-binding protein 1 isoform X1 n=2 Tax=Bombus terrestris TaxID=30195 RepID=A0A9B2MQJ8_BOMTE|nr:lipid storage droplets surface-binding protein 1 isoform X1 [Bombus terrestris]XP_050586806.1 lipid storage droplets surface-binding protein 1 isoform X1 [Bombus affinis]